MESTDVKIDFGDVVHVQFAGKESSCLILCEHASNRIPEGLGTLGLSRQALSSHIAWDPGAKSLATGLAQRLDGVLVTGNVSRLVYDCNRPPEAHSAVPRQSEVYTIPGNQSLSSEDRAVRVERVYKPFCKTVQGQIDLHRRTLDLLVTVHSFTPVYNGNGRDVEVGVVHGRDRRFSDALMGALDKDAPYTVRLNEPYSEADGVAHSLDLYGAANGLMNVMIEVRNDLLTTEGDVQDMANHLAVWIGAARSSLEIGG